MPTNLSAPADSSGSQGDGREIAGELARDAEIASEWWAGEASQDDFCIFSVCLQPQTKLMEKILASTQSGYEVRQLLKCAGSCLNIFLCSWSRWRMEELSFKIPQRKIVRFSLRSSMHPPTHKLRGLKRLVRSSASRKTQQTPQKT